MDDILIGSGTPWKLTFRNTLTLCDGTGGANAKAEVMSYSFYQSVPIPVTIDIKPGVYPNTLGLGSKSIIQVAILITPDFDALTVDSVTVIMAGATPSKSRKMDVDSDGDIDLLLYFKTQAMVDLTKDTTEATLTRKTDGEQPIDISGTDSVSIVTKGKK